MQVDKLLIVFQFILTGMIHARVRKERPSADLTEVPGDEDDEERAMVARMGDGATKRAKLA